MPEPSAASPEAVRTQLETIVASPGFAEAGRLGPFLTFLVERALAGEPVKESVVGVEVFGRAADYDPRLDPIVRVEARRLRSRLAEYYLGPGQDAPVLIELPKGTYVPSFSARAVAQPAEAEPEPEPAPGQPAARKRFRPMALLGVAVALLAGWLLVRPRNAPTVLPSVAVMPFVNLSEDKSNEYFSDGLTEELTDRLSRSPGLRVAARSSAFQFKGKAMDLRDVGQKLGVAAVVEGSVRKSGDRLRVTAQLVKVSDGYHLWSETFERRLSDVFAIQEDIAQAISNALRVELRVGFEPRPQPPTGDLDAYNLFLKARYHMNHDGLAGMEMAASALEQALQRDERYAPAHALLASSYAMIGYYQLRPAKEAWPKARAAAERAVALAPDMAEAHAVLGFILGLHEWRWNDAESEFRRALELNAASADVQATYAAAVLVPRGRLAEALVALRKAVDRAPDAVLANYMYGFAQLAAGRARDAIPYYRRATELSPSLGDIQWDLGMAYAYAGQPAEAERQFNIGGAIHESGAFRMGPVELALLGRKDEAWQMIRHWPGSRDDVRPIFAAYAYGVLGDRDATMRWLERAWDVRDPQLIWIRVDPRFRSMRDDPRFIALKKRVGLE